jgi:DNA-binding NtrC family response regulator
MAKTINKLIFVDDDKIQHMINRKNLLRIKPDIELFFFENPYEALEWFKSNVADLLILDVNMPEMQGWDFLKELAKIGNTIEVKMLTSSMDPMDVEISKKYGQVSGFLVKPLQTDVLMEMLGSEA